jgi:hypothetical protein
MLDSAIQPCCALQSSCIIKNHVEYAHVHERYMRAVVNARLSHALSST